MDISIIILNYKSKALTLNCLKSIKAANFTDLNHEIIVVDNNSNDGIDELLKWQYPEITFIKNNQNAGMGAGNNLGLRKARGKYVVIMNPDTTARPDTFVKMHSFMENNPQIGVAGPKQFNPDATVQNSCYRWYNLLTPLYRRTPLGKFQFAQKDLNRFLMRDFDGSYTREVDWLLGSFLFCRQEALKHIGLFDEQFFLYFEDTDLCRRFWNNNWQVTYYHEAEITHNHNRLSAQNPWYKLPWNPASRYHLISWIKYLRKWGVKSISN